MTLQHIDLLDADELPPSVGRHGLHRSTDRRAGLHQQALQRLCALARDLRPLAGRVARALAETLGVALAAALSRALPLAEAESDAVSVV